MTHAIQAPERVTGVPAAHPGGTSVACRECRYFDAAGPACRAGGRSPLRNCVIAINQEMVERLRPGDRVLEVGCGSWSYLRAHLPAGVEWHGIDVVAVYEGKPTIATALGSVAAIPFAEGVFDYVLANQSMEHWYEYGVPLRTGMAEVARVLRVGGQAWLNVPIHLHGARVFVAGDERRLFAALSAGGAWEVEAWERWRREPEPLERYAGWEIGSDVSLESLVPHPAAATSWVLNVGLRKVRGARHGAAMLAALRLAQAVQRVPALGALARAANRGPRIVARKVARRLGAAPRYVPPPGEQ